MPCGHKIIPATCVLTALTVRFSVSLPGVFDDMTKAFDATGSSTWQCSICGYMSKQITNVKRHVVAKHRKNEQLPCPVCKKRLKNKYIFNGHLKEFHLDVYDKHRYVLSHAK